MEKQTTQIETESRHSAAEFTGLSQEVRRLKILRIPSETAVAFSSQKQGVPRCAEGVYPKKSPVLR